MTTAGDWAGERGRGWAADAAALERQLAEPGEMALALLDAQPGERIIDLGCGAGPSAEAIARAVGPEGAVLALDVSAELSALARARLSPFAHAEVRTGDAATLGLAPASHDALFSRFGCMFFDDPPAAMAHLRGALKPGGRAALTVWAGEAANPWALLPASVAREVLGPDPNPTSGPGPFAWGEEPAWRAAMEGGGFREITMREADVTLPIGAGTEADPLADGIAMVLRIGPVAARLNRLENRAEAEQRLRPALAEVLAAHVSEGRLRLGGRVRLISALA